MKTCKKCGISKSLDEFRFYRGHYEGSCKACRYQQVKNNPNRAATTAKYRESAKGKAADRKNVLAKYGLTPEQYEEMNTGVCDICKQPEKRANRSLSVDHDHATLVIRGILCDNCNTVLGRVNDSIEHLEAMIEYLRRHNDIT